MPDLDSSGVQEGIRKGEVDESLRSLPRTDAGTGSGDVQGVQSLGDGGGGTYSVAVYGLAADGSSEPPAATPGTPEPTAAIVPVATPALICEWQCVLRSVGWDEWDIPEAGRKIQCESGFDPFAYNPSGASGWFQVMMPLHAYRLRSGEDIFDVYVNARVALEIFRERGWEAWVC